MRQMVEAGFDTVFIGIETPEEAGLAECGKRQNRNRDLVADVKRIQRAGLQVQAGSSWDSTARHARRLPAAGRADPGERDRHRDGRRPERPCPGRSSTAASSSRAVSSAAPRATTATARRTSSRAWTSPRSARATASCCATSTRRGPTTRRVRTLLREYRPPKSGVELSWRNVRTLVHASLRLGIAGRERFPVLGPHRVDALPPARAPRGLGHARRLRPSLPADHRGHVPGPRAFGASPTPRSRARRALRRGRSPRRERVTRGEFVATRNSWGRVADSGRPTPRGIRA